MVDLDKGADNLSDEIHAWVEAHPKGQLTRAQVEELAGLIQRFHAHATAAIGRLTEAQRVYARLRVDADRAAQENEARALQTPSHASTLPSPTDPQLVRNPSPAAHRAAGHEVRGSTFCQTCSVYLVADPTPPFSPASPQDRRCVQCGVADAPLRTSVDSDDYNRRVPVCDTCLAEMFGPPEAQGRPVPGAEVGWDDPEEKIDRFIGDVDLE